MATKNIQLTALLFTEQDDFAEHFVPVNTFETLQQSQFRAAKKAIRSKNPVVIIGDLRQSDKLAEFQQLAFYTKDQLHYKECQFLAIIDSQVGIDITQLNHDLTIDQVFDVAVLSKQEIQLRITKLALFIQSMTLSLKQSDAQSTLLMSVTRFSHHRQPVEQLIRCVAEALGKFCASTHSCIIYRDHIETKKEDEDDSYIATGTPSWIEGIAEQAQLCNSPKIHMLEPEETETFCEVFDEEIGSYILFPLRVYGENLASIACFISEDAMHLVSTQHLNVMRDVADQLRLVLEQRSAESRLEAQYQRLKSTMSELQTTKEQLVHSEKMASVGKIAAGLAHEINNPLSFVLGNFDPLNEYVDTLVKMLTLHDKFMTAITPDPTSLVLKNQIDSFKEDSELEYVVEDIQAIVNDSRDGLLRVRDIISDLSSFSHKQGLETQQVHIAEVIEEALRLLKYEISNDIQVENKIETDVVLISHRGFIQQVITNLVKNAAQALSAELVPTDNAKCISIYGNHTDKSFVITVQDNGPGISAEQLSKVFDPFFTTKEIGKGTGLGLSVCFNLAKKMGGSLTVESAPNDTTRFNLSIPNQ